MIKSWLNLWLSKVSNKKKIETIINQSKSCKVLNDKIMNKNITMLVSLYIIRARVFYFEIYVLFLIFINVGGP